MRRRKDTDMVKIIGVYIGIPPIIENQMEKKMENEMDTVVI